MLVLEWFKSVAVFLLSEGFVATDMVVIRQVVQESHRHRFTMCLPIHPCYHLKPGCTHGHLLEARFGGLSHCRNCLPQNMVQQQQHTAAFDICGSMGKMLRMVAYANITEPCGFTFHYECIGVWALVRLVIANWFAPNTNIFV